MAQYGLAKAVKNREKEFKQETTKMRKDYRDSSLAHQHKLTQKAFNRMRVLQELKWFDDQGLEPTCISCGKEKGNDQWCCGHFKTRGAQSGLRYDEKNTYLQHNFNCNMNLSGDIEGTKRTPGYKQGLINRFGTAAGNEIIEYCSINTKPADWTCDQLKEMRAEFSLKLKQLNEQVKL
jgi:hypothetical protein